MNKRRFGPEGDLFKRRQQLVAPIQDKVFAAIENYAAEKVMTWSLTRAGSAGLLFVKPNLIKQKTLKKGRQINNRYKIKHKMKIKPILFVIAILGTGVLWKRRPLR